MHRLVLLLQFNLLVRLSDKQQQQQQHGNKWEQQEQAPIDLFTLFLHLCTIESSLIFEKERERAQASGVMTQLDKIEWLRIKRERQSRLLVMVVVYDAAFAAFKSIRQDRRSSAG